MEQQVHQVVGARPQPEKLAIEHVGEPRQRLPVGGQRGGECPSDGLRVESLPDERVVDDGSGIVEHDEIVPNNGAEGRNGQPNEQGVDYP